MSTIELETDNVLDVGVSDNIELTSSNSVDTVGNSVVSMDNNYKSYIISSDDIVVPSSYSDAPAWMQNLIDNAVDESIAATVDGINGAIGNVDNAKADLEAAKLLYDNSLFTEALIDEKVAQKVEALEETLLGQVELAENAYTSSVITSEDIDTRINGHISGINTTLGNMSGDVTAIQGSMIDVDGVTTISKETIASEINSPEGLIKAQVDVINSSIATHNAARGQQITEVKAELDAYGIAGIANAVDILESSVGVGGYDGIGMLADLEMLKKQNDGSVDIYTGTYNVFYTDAENADNNYMVLTAEPYKHWIPRVVTSGAELVVEADDQNGRVAKAADGTKYQFDGTAWNSITDELYEANRKRLRELHSGDKYIKYKTVDGVKQILGTFKFINTDVDTSPPAKTDADGYTWAEIAESDSSIAYQAALNAQATADGKATIYVAQQEGSAPEDPGVNWFKADNKLYTKVNESWVEIVPEEGDGVSTYKYADDNGAIEDTNMYYYESGAWVSKTPDGIVASAKAVRKVEAFLDKDGDTFGGLSYAGATISAQQDDLRKKVNSQWAYNSEITIEDIKYTAGFGLAHTAVEGHTGTSDTSEFWVNARKIRIHDNGADYISWDDTNNKLKIKGAVEIGNFVDSSGDPVDVGTYKGSYATTSEPAGLKGDSYYNTTTQVMMYHNGSNWVTTSGVDGVSQYEEYEYSADGSSGWTSTLTDSHYFKRIRTVIVSGNTTTTGSWGGSIRIKKDPEDGVVYALLSTAQIIAAEYPPNEEVLEYTPSSITFTSKVKAGSGDVADYPGKFVCYKGDTLYETSSSGISSYTIDVGPSDNVSEYSVRLYTNDDVLLDRINIPVIHQGASAITAVLQNDATSIACEPNNTPKTGAYSFSHNNITVYQGYNKLTYNPTATSQANLNKGQFFVTTNAYEITPGALSLSTDDNKSCQVEVASGIEADYGLIYFYIFAQSLEGSNTTLAKVQTFNKVKDGEAGNDSVYYRLLVDRTVKYQKYGASTFTKGTSTASLFQYVNNVKTAHSADIKLYYDDSTTSEVTKQNVSVATFDTAPSDGCEVYKIVAYEPGTTTVLDTQIVQVVKEGEGVITVTNSNTYAAIPHDGNGNVKTGAFGATEVILRVYDGTTPLIYDGLGTSVGKFTVNRTATNCTLDSGIGSTGFSSYGANGITAISANTAQVSYLITGRRLDGVSFTEQTVQNFSKLFDGSNGTTTTVTERGPKIAYHGANLGTSTASAEASNIAGYWNTVVGASVGEVNGDQMILTNTNTSTGWTNIYTYGTSWTNTTKLVVHGDAVVDGTLSANKITTGQLQSGNWGTTQGSQFDLGGGTFKLGGSTSPKLAWDGTDLEVSGRINIDVNSWYNKIMINGKFDSGSVFAPPPSSASGIMGVNLDLSAVQSSYGVKSVISKDTSTLGSDIGNKAIYGEVTTESSHGVSAKATAGSSYAGYFDSGSTGYCAGYFINSNPGGMGIKVDSSGAWAAMYLNTGSSTGLALYTDGILSEQGEELSNRYLGKTATAEDSDKLGGIGSSWYATKMFVSNLVSSLTDGFSISWEHGNAWDLAYSRSYNGCSSNVFMTGTSTGSPSTGGTSSTTFGYIETSDGYCYDVDASVTLEWKIPVGYYNYLYWTFNMYGEHMGTLTISLQKASDDSWVDIRTKTGQQHTNSTFTNESVSVGGNVYKTLRIKYLKTVAGHLGDVCIQNLQIKHI